MGFGETHPMSDVVCVGANGNERHVGYACGRQNGRSLVTGIAMWASRWPRSSTVVCVSPVATQRLGDVPKDVLHEKEQHCFEDYERGDYGSSRRGRICREMRLDVSSDTDKRTGEHHERDASGRHPNSRRVQ
jgi:hypothetical protein